MLACHRPIIIKVSINCQNGSPFQWQPFHLQGGTFAWDPRWSSERHCRPKFGCHLCILEVNLHSPDHIWSIHCSSPTTWSLCHGGPCGLWREVAGTLSVWKCGHRWCWIFRCQSWWRICRRRDWYQHEYNDRGETADEAALSNEFDPQSSS